MIEHLILLKILNMMDIKGVLLQWFRNILIKTVGGALKNENMSDQQLAEELHKPSIRKFNLL